MIWFLFFFFFWYGFLYDTLTLLLNGSGHCFCHQCPFLFFWQHAWFSLWILCSWSLWSGCGFPQHLAPGWRTRHRPKSASYCSISCGLTGLGEPRALSLSNHSKSQDCLQLLEEGFFSLSLTLFLPHMVIRRRAIFIPQETNMFENEGNSWREHNQEREREKQSPGDGKRTEFSHTWKENYCLSVCVGFSVICNKTILTNIIFMGI